MQACRRTQAEASVVVGVKVFRYPPCRFLHKGKLARETIGHSDFEFVGVVDSFEAESIGTERQCSRKADLTVYDWSHAQAGLSPEQFL